MTENAKKGVPPRSGETALGTSTMLSGLTRRSFLKGAAATITVAGLGTGFVACTPKPTDEGGSTGAQVSDDQIFQGTCPNDCGGGCAMNVHVRDGHIVKTSAIDLPDPLMTRVCQRGLSHAQRVYAPERVKYPMRRAGERGEGKWEQITWDEAIAEICEKWKSSQETYGPMSVAFQCGTGNSGPDQYYNTRLCTALGGTFLYPMADMNGLYMAALMVTRGPYLHGGSLNQILESKKIFVWSSNTTTSGHAKWAYVQAARDKGAKLIVVDPNYTRAAAMADIWVPVRPGTDAALAMAMTKVIIDEGLADVDYLTKGTVAPFLVKDSDGLYLHYSDIGLAEKKEAGEGLHLDGSASTQAAQDDGSDPIVVMGKDGKFGSYIDLADPVIEGSFVVEGVACKTVYTLLIERIAEWTLEKTAALTEVPTETIASLAREYADGPTMNYLGFGMDHWVNGPYPYHAIITMAFVSGNFGKPGASIDGNMQGSMGIAGVNVNDAIAFEGMQQGMALATQYLPELLDSGQIMGIPLTIKCLFSYCGNPLVGIAGGNDYQRFVDQLDFLLVADMVMNDTAKMADMVLPVPHWFEVESFNAGVLPTVRINEQAITPLYEAKSDIEICNLIGEGMGIGNIMNLTSEQFHAACMSGEGAKEVGLSWEKLKEDKMIQVLPDDYVFGADYTLPTPTTKAEFYFENIQPMMPFGGQPDAKLLSLPHWEPPFEGWHENPLAEKYPLVLMTQRDKARVNSTFTYCPWLEEIFPEPTVDLSPGDAAARNIKSGDVVRVFNDRSSLKLKARINAGTRPGLVITPRGANADHYIEGNYNKLTPSNYNKLVASGGWNDTLVQIEKA
jgi:molybdopterin-containing oxidoreductase family molybdopterin binding subunit